MRSPQLHLGAGSGPPLLATGSGSAASSVWQPATNQGRSRQGVVAASGRTGGTQLRPCVRDRRHATAASARPRQHPETAVDSSVRLQLVADDAKVHRKRNATRLARLLGRHLLCFFAVLPGVAATAIARDHGQRRRNAPIRRQPVEPMNSGQKLTSTTVC